MEWILSHCTSLLAQDMPLLWSAVLAGMVGSITHCSLMCSPLVAAQMLALDPHQKPQLHMLYFHAGRIVTYMLMGLLAVSAAHWVFAGSMAMVTHILLLFAGLGFVFSALLPRKTHGCCGSGKRFDQVAAHLPQRLVLFLRGLAMGGMPCGMTFSILLLVATLRHPLEAMAVMAAFGLANTPILHVSGATALQLKRRHPASLAVAGRSVMALNGLFLCGLGLNHVSVY